MSNKGQVGPKHSDIKIKLVLNHLAIYNKPLYFLCLDYRDLDIR